MSETVVNEKAGVSEARALWKMPVAASAYRGPERRHARPLQTACLAAMLDEVNYGMVLVDARARVLHVNRVARGELRREQLLRVVDGLIAARIEEQSTRLRLAIGKAAVRGLRDVLALGSGRDQRGTVAVVPLAKNESAEPVGVVLVFEKRSACEALSVQWFARSHALSQAEAQVLEGLCAGDTPLEIAQRHGVALSTVRSQISALRAKTEAASIRQLVHQVSTLPPLVGCLNN